MATKIAQTVKKKSTYHVDNSQDTRPVPQQPGNTGVVVGKGNVDDTKCDIGGEVGSEEEQLEACGQRPDVDGRAKLDLAVVSLPEDWGV